MLFYASYFSRTLLICVFLLAILGTLWSKKTRRAFTSEVADIPFFPRRMSPTIATAIVLLEAAIVALLMRSETANYGLRLAFALLMAFTLSFLTGNRKSEHDSCNCFGALGSTSRRTALVRNGLLLAAAAFGLFGAAATPPANYSTSSIVAAQAIAGVAVLSWYIASPFIDEVPIAPRTQADWPPIWGEAGRGSE